MEVIVPCAGLGTRLLPGSKSIPKEMFPIVNKPAIDYIAEEIKNSGLNDIILITGKNKDSIVDYFDSDPKLETELLEKKKTQLLNSIMKFNNLNVVTIRQKKMLGLGHAVYIGKKIVKNRPFCVVLPDMIIENGHKYLSLMVKLYKQYKKGIIGLMRVKEDEIESYGIVKINNMKDDICNITDIVEKPKLEDVSELSNLAVVGRYVLPGHVFEILKETRPGNNGEIQLTDALKILSQNNELMGVIIDEKIYDIGTPLGFIKANLGLSLSLYKEELKDFISEVF